MKGNLLINLGSPKQLSIESVKDYLTEFLSDDLVIDFPKPIQRFLVKGIIVPLRHKKTFESYKKIWTDEGSPLIVISKKLAQRVQDETGIKTEVGMRYKEPSIKDALNNLINQGCEEIRVLPLYPQFTGSSSLTSINKVKELKKELNSKSINYIYKESFYNDQNYIKYLTESISRKLPDNVDYLLFSFHGLPNRQDTQFEPSYSSQCKETSRLVAEKLGFSEKQWGVSFQSRLGPGWTKPFTDKVLSNLPNEGKKNLAVVSPAFYVDNLETLEELSIEGKKTFLDSGGEEFTYIDCLNDSDFGVKVIASLLK
ncbi:MAG: ferrochelatase [Gammaproteobacteria bacterium]|nr:ferrochelatase [Gammaproteobacteria bacterium]